MVKYLEVLNYLVVGEPRDLELSMRTRLNHPGLRSGEVTLARGRLVSLLMP